MEVNRPNRATRRARGKSDPIDAEAAARAALAGVATAVPKSHSGLVEGIRVIFVARRGAAQARTAAINTLHQMIITAPMRLRDQLQPLTRRHQITTCARFHAKDLTDPARATRLALRRLARRIDHLTTEIDDAEHDLTELVAELAPQLLAEPGVGPLSAAQLLITAGDNPDRMTSPAGFAALCGTTPIPVSSGKTNRHRLNRGGDRQANCALHTIVLSRLRYHPETQAYATNRSAENKTDLDIPPQPEALPRPPPVRAHPQPQPSCEQHPPRRLTNHRSITSPRRSAVLAILRFVCGPVRRNVIKGGSDSEEPARTLPHEDGPGDQAAHDVTGNEGRYRRHHRSSL